MPTLLLHQYPPLPGNLSMSPFCCKVHIALRLRGVDYAVRNAMFPSAANKYGQFPLLEWDGEKLNDSSHILQTLDARVPSDRPFFPKDRAQAAEVHLMEDWSDEALARFSSYAKFIDDEGWALVRPNMAKMLPGPMGALAPIVARRKLRRLLHAQGLLRKSLQQVEQEFDSHLDMLDQRLENRRYLCGDAPTAADCSVVGILDQQLIANTAFFGKRIARRPRLSEYLQRLRKESRTEG